MARRSVCKFQPFRLRSAALVVRRFLGDGHVVGVTLLASGHRDAHEQGIGAQPADFTFAGEAPGLVSGVMQLNVTIPLTAASGDQAIIVSIGATPSQTGVTVSIR